MSQSQNIKFILVMEESTLSRSLCSTSDEGGYRLVFYIVVLNSYIYSSVSSSAVYYPFCLSKTRQVTLDKESTEHLSITVPTLSIYPRSACAL